MLPRGVAPRALLYVLFTFSGFAGLIYESVWSHYLKLFLGHAAYAQTLVLMIFMGGMAIGAWLAGEFSRRCQQPLLWYAGVEALLGLAALMFDRSFLAMQAWLFDGVIPQLDAGWAIDLAKWGSSAMIILPQSILLGATFPLMSAGLVRLYPEIRGRALSWLYFTNSLGASVGVLVSGFVLVDAVGLPGTILTAGLVNFILALGVYLVWRRAIEESTLVLTSQTAQMSDLPQENAQVLLMLAAAFLTGTASFLYEIGWIRMLSLVLGSSTHAFELMLSAFILGLALGSFFIRNRIDGAKNPLRLLGMIQVIMATLALVSLPLYMQTFDLMGEAFQSLEPNEGGYRAFMLFSHLLCLVLMLPVTFCAGMTLPLITTILLQKGYGEASIGRVYAANTCGAIVGVLLAVHVVMPVLGLRQVVIVGALVDFALGFWLLAKAGGARQGSFGFALPMLLLLSGAIVAFVDFDPRKTDSGVYRFGISAVEGEVLFHRDGKTASVSVRRAPDGLVSIATNGKVDAGFFPDQPSSDDPLMSDDFTMVLLGALPFALRPDTRTVGVIGMGSGRTTHTLLANPRLERVDTVEIEPAMVQGARMFGPMVARTFEDPRSHIAIEDAKTYFSRSKQQYDVVVSEPSNPWVSGVSSLFSREFYHQIKRHLVADGLFVQWVQLYEIDPPLVATIVSTLGQEFSDYDIYFTNGIDMLIVATPSGRLPRLRAEVFGDPKMAEILKSIGVNTMADLDQRRIGGKATLSPFLASYGMPFNSDYFPVLDQNAAKRRFLRVLATSLTDLHPYSMRLEEGDGRASELVRPVVGLAQSQNIAKAQSIDRLFDWRLGLTPDKPQIGDVALADTLATLIYADADCSIAAFHDHWSGALKDMIRAYGPYVSARTGEAMAALLGQRQCYKQDPQAQLWVDLLKAQSARDWLATARTTKTLMEMAPPGSPDIRYLVAERLLAEIKLNGFDSARTLMDALGVSGGKMPMPIIYLAANIEANSGSRVVKPRPPSY